MRKLALSVAIAAALYGCGGGGGGGSAPVVSVPFTLSNYDVTGTSASAGLLDVGTTASSLTSLTELGGAGSVQIPGTGLLGVLDMVLAQVGSLNGSGREQIADSGSAACPFGGSIFVSTTSANSFTMTFSACVAASGAEAVNGSVDVSFSGVVLDGNNKIASGTLFMTAHNMTSSGSTLNGSVTVSLSSSSIVLAYSGYTSARNSRTTTYNYTVTLNKLANPYTLSVQGNIIIGGATYVLSTPVTITTGTPYPTSGTLRVTDQNGGYVNVVIDPTNFELDLFLPGDGVRDGLASHTWADLAAGNI